MAVSLPQSQHSLSARPSGLVWAIVFLSPSAYFLLLLLAGGLRIPEWLAMVGWLLLPVVPVAALVYCASIVWSHSRTSGGRIGGTALTVVAMLLQCGVLLFVLYAIVVTLISYAQ